MSDNWWARKLAPQQQQQAPPRPQYYPGRQAPQVPQQPQYPQQWQQPPQQQEQPPPQEERVTHDNFMQMAGKWQGGEAARTETHPCPSCGGPHYFSRSQGARRGPPPAPLCADCGYNGLFEQADQANWQAAQG